MPDVKISQLPQRSALSTDFVPVIDSSGTQTSKVTVATIAAVGGGPPASHAHGNITNAGAIGSTADLPVKTGASGVLVAGAFGTTSGTFCQGNDARLSDTRTPSTHASTHKTSGTDPIALDIPANVSLTANLVDWYPNSGVGDILKFSSSTANLTISGVSANMKAQAILLVNTGATNTVILLNDNATSAAANRILTPTAGNYSIGPRNSCAIWYDPEASRWRVVA